MNNRMPFKNLFTQSVHRTSPRVCCCHGNDNILYNPVIFSENEPLSDEADSNNCPLYPVEVETKWN